MKSEVKKSIDAIIDKDAWMTPSLAKKMATPSLKKRKHIFWIPTAITIFTCTLLFVLLNNNISLNESSPLNSLEESNITSYIEDTSLANALLTYLHAIETNDTDQLYKITNNYEDDDIPALLNKYKDVQFDSIKVLKVNPIPYTQNVQVYLTLKIAQSENQYIHILDLEPAENGWTIYETSNQSYIVYKPYVSPSTLTFHYESVSAFEKDNSYNTKDIALAYPSIKINGNLQAHFYVENNTAKLVMQQDSNYYPITTYQILTETNNGNPYQIEVVENANGLNYYIISTAEKGNILALFYNESIDKFQAIEAVGDAQMTHYDVDENGIDELFITGQMNLIATVEVGQLVASYTLSNFSDYMYSAFTTMSFNKDEIHVTYEDNNMKKNSTYKWKTVNEAYLLTNKKDGTKK